MILLNLDQLIKKEAGECVPRCHPGFRIYRSELRTHGAFGNLSKRRDFGSLKALQGKQGNFTLGIGQAPFFETKSDNLRDRAASKLEGGFVSMCLFDHFSGLPCAQSDTGHQCEGNHHFCKNVKAPFA